MIKREKYLERLRAFKDTDVIKVVTGARRSGKSTLLGMFRDELVRGGIDLSHTISINFEDLAYRDILTAEAAYDYITAKLTTDQKYYIFLDEIQNVVEFEKMADSLYIKDNVDLYITGSNAYFLSSELATMLTGRYIQIHLLPLSFAEYTTAFTDNKPLAERFEDYIRYGSFPYVAELLASKNTGIDIDTYLLSIYDTILYKDILARLQPEDATKIEHVARFMLDNIGSKTSPSKISNTLTSMNQKVSHPTVDSYLKALVDSFVLYKASRYDIKGKRLLQTLDKYYVVDTGLRRTVLGANAAKDRGHTLENVVYLELLRRNNNVWIGKEKATEIDFVTQTRDGQTKYYQVTETMLSEETRSREIRPLDRLTDHNPKYIITMDYGSYSYNGIQQVNILDWLLKEEKR